MRRLRFPSVLALFLFLPAELAEAGYDSDEFASVIEVLDPDKKWVVTFRDKVWSCTAYKTCEGIKANTLLSPELQFKLLPEVVMYVGKNDEVQHCWLQTCKDYRKCGLNSWAPGCKP